MMPRSSPIFDRIKTSKNLPTLPHILLKLIEACNSQESSIPDISRIIDKDSSLSAKVMRLVNSAHYGLPTRIASVEQALLLLGTDAVKNIAVSAAVFQVFGGAKADGAFNLRSFWYHSLLCATIAELIARKTKYGIPEEAFLAGLLHDVGKMVLWVNFPKDYTEILETLDAQTGLIGAEGKRLGTNHAEVGAWMIGRWELQSFMADAVLYHHETATRIQDALPLVKMVYVANILSTNPDGSSDLGYQAAGQVLGLARSDVDQMVLLGKEQVEHVARTLGMDLEPQGTSPDADMGQQKEIDLLRNVRDASLLQGTLQNLLHANGRKSILPVVRQGLQVLFDLDRIFFLLHDPEQNILTGKEGLETTRDLLAKELAISLETKNCLPVQALDRKTPLDSFGHLTAVNLSIIDDQLIRLVDKEGFLCMPMIAHQKTIGVILIGIDRAALTALNNQMNLLNMFVDQSALALYVDAVRQAQARLIQSERLAAASAVAKKVVHEVNNPLGIIKNYIKIFALKLPKDDPVQEELKIISEELDRVALIIRGLSDFSEPAVRQAEAVDLNALLSALVKITRESFMRNSGVNVHLRLDPALPPVFSEKNGLKQVVINIIKNAVEAMPRGGNLYITTEHLPKRIRDGMEKDLSPTFDSVEVGIRDEGPGIPQQIKARLFEPYVTSKKGEHAGLGLSVAYHIVKELNGTLTCESEEGAGTTFRIVLPVA
jgi:putative nucleotidyltransferase with HDIG domain